MTALLAYVTEDPLRTRGCDYCTTAFICDLGVRLMQRNPVQHQSDHTARAVATIHRRLALCSASVKQMQSSA